MFLSLAVALLFVSVEASVKCFCDRSSCDDRLICEGDFCLIGLRANDDGGDGALLQQCGSGSARGRERCEQQVADWHEVCHCQDDFCNTFSFLRSRIDDATDVRESLREPPEALPPLYHPPRAFQSNSLIILLVIIPLSVGGLAVCLIFVNYHCKMC